MKIPRNNKTDPKSHSSKAAQPVSLLGNRSLQRNFLPQFQIMHCIWKLFRWPKRQRPEDDERLPLETFDRITLLQTLEGSQNGEYRDDGKTCGLQERYVRYGIGGAGNMRKYCFLLLLFELLSFIIASLADIYV
jgi:hypothetical protein